MSITDIVIIVFGIAFIAFIGGAAACLWIGVIKEWMDMKGVNKSERRNSHRKDY